MSCLKSKMSRPIGRNCSHSEFSAAGNLFSTSAYKRGFTAKLAQQETRGPEISISYGWIGTLIVAVLAVLATAAVPPAVYAQLPPPQAPPGWGQVPQGTGACSVEASCADLAPGMIKKALGPSPLNDEVSVLAKILASRDPSAGKRAAKWAIENFHRAGADNVRAEKFSPSSPFESVIADVRGRERQWDYVLIAGTLNASGTNPLTTAENVASLVDAVRVIHASGSIPRRSIRFVLFAVASDGSSGYLASEWAYLHQHYADVDHIAAAVAIDAAGEPIDGFSLEDRPDILSATRQALEPLKPLGVRNFTEGVNIPSPVTPFWLEGMPALVSTPIATSIALENGPRSGTGAIEPAKLQHLKRGVAIEAVTAYALADAESRIGPRRPRSQVEHSIASGGLEPKLKANGLWNEWQSAQRRASQK